MSRDVRSTWRVWSIRNKRQGSRISLEVQTCWITLESMRLCAEDICRDISLLDLKICIIQSAKNTYGIIHTQAYKDIPCLRSQDLGGETQLETDSAFGGTTCCYEGYPGVRNDIDEDLS